MVRMQDRTEAPATQFNAIRISVASPEQILNWSHGEVTKPETINYRTLRPEKDGLFCERLFGPTKDWECFCGKYKRIRYRGVVCDRCGVEVTRSKVRRERMGHIRLAAPVAHIWFSKTNPSRLGLLLDLSPRNLERVLYFAQHIVISVDGDRRTEIIEEEKLRVELEKEKLQVTHEPRLTELQEKLDALEASSDPESVAESVAVQAEKEALEDQIAKEEGDLEYKLQETISELEDLKPLKILSESKCRELKEKYPDLFEAGMGAESILEILRNHDLEAIREGLVREMRSSSGQRRKKAIKRLQVVEAFRNSGNRVEDIILTMLPVLPPELRPMVQLDGGRFATSDLNDLYRRVINRNNRLKRLMDLGAPEIIIRNEKRMLQESVDALIDNGRRGRPIQGSHNHKLKSLSDLLRGKQGRFRQNLLGKRVDYSGRSVIVVGPELKMNQCGLPKRMALELFKPFVMHRLVLLGVSPNIKSAKRMVERARPEVWDILEEVIKDRPVMLNRAPTLHRLGIQAFMPTLIEGHAIQLHPLVCSAFNADFDGDQMAVHVPLSRMAVHEARVAMLSTNNMLSPASGEPLVAPTLDMVLGCYYLTEMVDTRKDQPARFYNIDEARIAEAAGHINLRERIYVKKVAGAENVDGWVETTLGRLIFNEKLNEGLPQGMEFKNQLFNSRSLKDLTADLYYKLDNESMGNALDRVKALGFEYATRSGLTVSISDLQVPAAKADKLRQADEEVATYAENYDLGLMDDNERYDEVVDAWTRASDEIELLVKEQIESDRFGGIGIMAESGTKGNIMQIKQMAGMRGLMTKPSLDRTREIIELPVKSSFREGLTALEYFISTHGARKGLADTALRTADSGYLTRRLVDIAQEVIVLEEDCGTYDAYYIEARPDGTPQATLPERIAGRIAAAPIIDEATGEFLVDRNDMIDEAMAERITAAGVTQVPVRSPLICETRRGVCQMCYGRLPATGKVVELGQAVGIIAAQSIGEPGTQLTMRTFHTGGVAGSDITSGLPRVEEIFEARKPKGVAILSEIEGEVQLPLDGEGRRLVEEPVRIVDRQEFREEYVLPEGVQLLVDEGDEVEAGMLMAATLPTLGYEADTDEATESQPVLEVVANVGGRVELDDNLISIVWEDPEEREYPIPVGDELVVTHGDMLKAGDRLTAGPKNPHDILSIQGTGELQQYMVNEVQQVYRSQGVGIHDKHVEIILRQMLRRVQVKSIGDSDFIPDQVVDKVQFQENCARVLAQGGEPATAEPVLLGVTRASLRTDSFLAAAAFQETTRVLTQAALSGQHDYLQGLKENVIIGRLIPARLESTTLVEEPDILALPGFDQIGGVEELVTAGWLEPGDAGAGAAMTFGGGSDDLAASGFFVENEANFIGGDGGDAGGPAADVMGPVGDVNVDPDFADFSLEGDADF